ncbi:GDP-L-fucose synthase family protein [Methylobacterium nonmethylotrophicum]|nr:GDP-L-fucose synthase [Methylobacterium nonmethylotrophicum]
MNPEPGLAFPLAGRRVFVAGPHGMVGSAIVRRLARVECEVLTAGRTECDLRDPAAVTEFFARTRPDAVFLAAAVVGGIHANAAYPVDFLHDNLMIAASVIGAAHRAGVAKLMFLGSSCIYPKHAPQPMTEDALLTGPLEPTNEPYAIAKIAGIKLCDAYRRQYGADFVSVMPTNLYGRGDNYHPENAHVPAALIRRFDAAKRDGAESVTVWGTGTPLREFLCADDLADACVFLMERQSWAGPLNIGTGDEVSIADFARTVAEVVGYDGRIAFDTSRPDGAPRKRLDVSRLTALGWRPRISLREGLAAAYADYLAGGGRYR